MQDTTHDTGRYSPHQQNGTPTARAVLADELRRTIAASAAYIPAHLVRTQLANPEPGRISGSFWQGSLLSADLSGFTRMSEQLSVLGRQSAEEVSTVINQLFSALVVEVFAYRGELLKFGGDELIAFFDAEMLGEAHAAAATNAAMAMQVRMDSSFATVKTRAGTFTLRLRVSIHSGQFFAAEVGDTDHIELVVTGVEVKRVAMAQKMTAPGEVIISDQTAALLQNLQATPRQAGFQQVISLPDIVLPPPSPGIALFIADGDDDDDNTITRLQAQEAALRPYLVRGMPRRFLDSTIAEVGEFRPVNVLFVNFRDFSLLLNAFGTDVERAALALNAYFRRVQAVVHHYDGIINKADAHPYGDRLMILFGAPNVHEDDTLRAVRCAFELETVLTEANSEIAMLLKASIQNHQAANQQRVRQTLFAGFQQRIAINTGSVFAGRVGGERRYEYTVMGTAVNLSARLMEAATNGTIMLSPNTRAAVERYIAIEEQPPLHMKGLTEPITPVRALHMRAGQRQEIPSHPSARLRSIILNQSAMVGRDTELQTILREARTALRGKGRVIALVGEAGLGKTRLIQEFSQELVLASTLVHPAQGEDIPPFLIYTGDRESYEQSVPYSTIRPVLRYLLGLKPDNRKDALAKQTSEQDTARYSSRVERFAPQLARFIPVLNDILDTDFPETPLTQSLTHEQRHHRIQELVIALMLGAAAFEPLLLVFDDLHWADVTSLELLANLAKALEETPILLFLSYRPESHMTESWLNIPSTTRLRLNELSSATSVDLLQALLAGKPPQVLLPLLERTQGNPFFIQELVRELITSGTLSCNDSNQWFLTRPLEQITVPNNVEGLIRARLDQLDEASYEFVQIASVVGYRFHPQLLAGIYTNPTPLEESLQRLIDIAMIVVDPRSDDSAYVFRHALLRDVVYEGILYSRRHELHCRVAQRIEMLHADNLNEHLVLLAQHYLLAEAWETAYRYHLEAGFQAQERHANHEALALFIKALEIAHNLDEEREQKMIELYEYSGNLYLMMGEYDQAQTTFLEALNLIKEWRKERGAWKMQEQTHSLILSTTFARLMMRLYRLIASVQEQRGDYDGAFSWLARSIAWSNTETQDELARCYLLGAAIYQHQGDYKRALDWARKGLAGAEQLHNRTDQAQALLLVGNCWREQGRFQSSIESLEQAHSLFEQINDATNLSIVLKDMGETYRRYGRWKQAVRCYDQALQIADAIGDVIAKAHITRNLAVLMVGRGALPLAEELYTYSLEQFKRIGSVMAVAITNLNRGEALLLQARPAEALQLFQESIATFERVKARNVMPEGLRLAAEALLTLNEYEQAAAYANRSLAIACELGLALDEAIARRLLGIIAFYQHDFDTASTMFQTSRTALEQMESHYELGKVLFCQARLAHAIASTELSNGESVTELLSQAKHIFKQLGAKRDLTHTHDLAKAGGYLAE